jgi:transposase
MSNCGPVIRRPTKVDPKLRSLQESGTANPHAQDVRDPAFVDSDFFDPRDLIQVKYEMLRRVRTDGQSIAKASAQFGVSRPTFYKARSDFDRSGLVGLLPAKRGPRGAHKITPEVARFIEETVARGEELSARQLAERIAEHFGVVVHQRTVKRALARLKEKRTEAYCRQSRWSRVGGALRGFTVRCCRPRRSPSYAAQFVAAHAKRNGSVDQRRRGGAPTRDKATSPASSAMCMPEGIERSLFDILAAMALATALEGVNEFRYSIQSSDSTP